MNFCFAQGALLREIEYYLLPVRIHIKIFFHLKQLATFGVEGMKQEACETSTTYRWRSRDAVNLAYPLCEVGITRDWNPSCCNKDKAKIHLAVHHRQQKLKSKRTEALTTHKQLNSLGIGISQARKNSTCWGCHDYLFIGT